MMGLPDGPKSFPIGLVVLIQYRLWQTATQPASHPASHVAVAIRLYAKASSLKIKHLLPATQEDCDLVIKHTNSTLLQAEPAVTMSYEWKCSVLTSVSVHAICVAIFLYSSVAIILLVAYLAIVTCLDNSFLVRFLSDTHNQNACMNCSYTQFLSKLFFTRFYLWQRKLCDASDT